MLVGRGIRLAAAFAHRLVVDMTTDEDDVLDPRIWQATDYDSSIEYQGKFSSSGCKHGFGALTLLDKSKYLGNFEEVTSVFVYVLELIQGRASHMVLAYSCSLAEGRTLGNLNKEPVMAMAYSSEAAKPALWDTSGVADLAPSD